MIRTTLKHCIVSPFKSTNESEDEKYAQIYTEALEFGINQIRGGDKTKSDNFYKMLQDHLISSDWTDDLQEYIIYMDYIMFDFIQHQHQMSYLDVKNLVFSRDLQTNNEGVKQLIVKVVNQLKWTNKNLQRLMLKF